MNIGAGSLNRVQELEDNIKTYKKQTEILESELSKVNDEVAASKQKCKLVRSCGLHDANCNMPMLFLIHLYPTFT